MHSANGKNDDKLKSTDLLSVEQNPVISFKTNKVVQTGKTTYDLIGTFNDPRRFEGGDHLNLVIADQGSGSGYAQGTLSFDRKDFGMTSQSRGDNTVEVDLGLKVEQVSGPPLVRKQFR